LAATEELKALWWNRPKCVFLPRGSGAEVKPRFSAGEKSGAGMDMPWRAGLAVSATGKGQVRG